MIIFYLDSRDLANDFLVVINQLLERLHRVLE
jgi:hypothetical protein